MFDYANEFIQLNITRIPIYFLSYSLKKCKCGKNYDPGDL